MLISGPVLTSGSSKAGKDDSNCWISSFGVSSNGAATTGDALASPVAGISGNFSSAPSTPSMLYYAFRIRPYK